MKRLSCIFVITFCLWGCGSSPNKSNVQVQKEPTFILKGLLDSLINESPNLMNNDITKQDFANILTSNLRKYRTDTLPFLSELPVAFEMSMQYPESDFENAGKYVVKFGFGSSKFTLSKDYQTTFQIFTVMDKENAATLIDGEFYHVKGIFIDFANNSKETGFVFPNGKCIIDYPKISVSSLGNVPFINLGSLIIENATFTKYEVMSK